MGSNSIRCGLDKDDIISEIRLSKSADIKKENVYLVVEGPDDIRFFKKFISKNLTLYESFSGKMGVEEIVTLFNDKRVIGVRDKDYQNKPVSAYIFYYDYCCLEIMLAMNNDVFSSVFEEFYGEKKSFVDVRKHVMEALKPYSAVRMLNEKRGWEIPLAAIPVTKCTDSTKLISKEKFFQHVRKFPNTNFDENAVERELNKVWSDEDLCMRTQGHDFLQLFAYICNRNKLKAGKDVGDECIAKCLRSSFNIECLKKTMLYQSIKKFEDKKKLKIWAA
ncbi:hypothetical protein [Fibrobacter sp.]|uniref:hypothetical protein n=1 Tax=Fibrobacter sp. TaxID=35828 RepID=UPI003890C8CF